MNIAVGSAFRNSALNVPRYLERVAALKRALPAGWRVRVNAVEGDSTDDTATRLVRQATYLNLDLQLTAHHHGGPVFGSVESAARMTALSGVGNAIFDGVTASDDLLLYVESDLLWEPDVALTLLQHVQEGLYDVAAPMVMAADAFYDIWAFRNLNGERFSPFKPFDQGFTRLGAGELLEVSSVGSCLAMRGSTARACRIRDNNCLVGWCADARAQGFTIAVDPRVTVRQL